MIYRFSIFIILICSFYNSIAQGNYSSSELESFVFIYMDQKNNHRSLPVANEFLNEMEEVGLSEKRYKEIFSKMILGEDILLTDSEESFFALQKEKHKTEKANKEEYVKVICKTLNLDITTYKKIESAYKSDIKFQRSLKPHFDKYFKRRK